MRVLIVEDEVRLAERLARGLGAEGFSCDVVHDGAEGLWRATEFPYAVVVLDLLLPAMNGFTVCRRLRAAGNWTPVIILTAKDGEYDEAEGLDTGADDYLTKPFSYVVLVAHLGAGDPPAAGRGQRGLAGLLQRVAGDRGVRPLPGVTAATRRRDPGATCDDRRERHSREDLPCRAPGHPWLP